jgi:hypothetical protein
MRPRDRDVQAYGTRLAEVARRIHALGGDDRLEPARRAGAHRAQQLLRLRETFGTANRSYLDLVRIPDSFEDWQRLRRRLDRSLAMMQADIDALEERARRVPDRNGAS